MKEFYKKYVNYIVGLLFALWCGSSCKRCSLERQLDWKDYNCEIVLDSLKNTNDILNRRIDSLNNEITVYKYKVIHLEELEQSLKENNKYLRTSNNQLIKNAISSNKENNKE